VTRAWTEFVAAVSDVVPLPLLTLLLFVGAGIAGALWYWFPAWVPRRMPRLRRPAWRLRRPRWRLPRWRRPVRRRPEWLRLTWWAALWAALWRALRWPWRRREPADEPAPAPEPEPTPVPELPAAELVSLADRLAAEGRYAEAVRERLRAMVRRLVEHAVIGHRPDWTVTELAAAAGAALPPAAGPLGEAAGVFSAIWYAQCPATAESDARMRALAASVDDLVERRPAWAVR
jgi:hypothetical protein